jgi:hypothetical protein
MEFLDRPDCDPALAAASYRFMETVNARFGGIRVVRRFLAAETAGRYTGAPFRILDIGSGSCDIPLAVSRWARAYGISPALHLPGNGRPRGGHCARAACPSG